METMYLSFPTFYNVPLELPSNHACVPAPRPLTLPPLTANFLPSDKGKLDLDFRTEVIEANNNARIDQ